MKRALAFIAILALSIGSLPAHAQDLSRDQIVTEWNTKYLPQFEDLYKEFTALKSPAKSVPTIQSSLDFVFKDYAEILAVINGAVQDPKGDVSSIIGYAEEEIDELKVDLAHLKDRLAKVKTIKCVKGKTVKTLKVEKVLCPKGYTLKK